jgi:hypothetical protein
VTSHKHLKQLIRARMEKTGERYAAARRHIIAQQSFSPGGISTSGNVPASTALRILLTQAGCVAPHTKAPPTEALVFGVGGGVGAGVFAFHYAKEDISTFYVAGRHQWQDDVAWFDGACRRFGVEPHLHETSSVKAADKALRQAIEGGRPVIAWVDMGSLPYYGLPAWMSGSGYHVVTVLGIDDRNGTVRIGDMGDQPVEVPQQIFSAARARIKKQQNRLLWIEGAPARFDLRKAVNEALEACSDKLTKQRMRNFTLSAFEDWAERLAATKGKESWAVMFAPGHRLFSGVRWAYEFIETYGTGGGLCRPQFAEFLSEVAVALDDSRLKRAAEAYRELGEEWSALADALLDNEIPLLAEAKRAIIERGEAREAGAPVEEMRAQWARLDALGKRARQELMLDESRAAEWRKVMAEKVRHLHAREGEALAMIRRGK